jgi:hypothetical protein
MWSHVQLWKCIPTEFSLPFDNPCPHKEDSHPFQYGYDILQLDSIHSNRATLGAQQPRSWMNSMKGIPFSSSSHYCRLDWHNHVHNSRYSWRKYTNPAVLHQRTQFHTLPQTSWGHFTFLKRVVCQKLSTRTWQFFKLIAILCNFEHLPWCSVWDPAN